MPRRRNPSRRQQNIERFAILLSALLADGELHSNYDIKRRTGMAWDHPLAEDVRRYLRSHGVYITPHSIDGFWVMTDTAAEQRKHRVRRAKNAYSEACTNAKACAGSVARNPADAALQAELVDHQRWAYLLAGVIGKTPMEVAMDLTPEPTPPNISTL